jgi:hypothetical protein
MSPGDESAATDARSGDNGVLSARGRRRSKSTPWVIVGAVVLAAAVIAVVLATGHGTPARPSAVGSACNATTFAKVVNRELAPVKGTVTTFTCQGTWAVAAYNATAPGTTGNEWGISIYEVKTGNWKQIGGGNDGTCLAAMPGEECDGYPAPAIAIPHSTLLTLIANAGLVFDGNGDVFTKSPAMSTQALPCSQQALFEYVEVQSVTVRATEVTASGHTATLQCGGLDDMHYVEQPTPVTITFAQTATLTILDQDVDYAQELATPRELAAYVRQNPDGNIFRVTGQTTGAAGLYAMFHP